MNYRYQVKIGGRTISSNVPFKVSLVRRNDNSEKDDNELSQETKKAYYRTIYDSPKRQNLPSYEYGNEKQKNDIQGGLQKQITNSKNSRVINYFDCRGSNLFF